MRQRASQWSFSIPFWMSISRRPSANVAFLSSIEAVQQLLLPGLGHPTVALQLLEPGELGPGLSGSGRSAISASPARRSMCTDVIFHLLEVVLELLAAGLEQRGCRRPSHDGPPPGRTGLDLAGRASRCRRDGLDLLGDPLLRVLTVEQDVQQGVDGADSEKKGGPPSPRRRSTGRTGACRARRTARGERNFSCIRERAEGRPIERPCTAEPEGRPAGRLVFTTGGPVTMRFRLGSAA